MRRSPAAWHVASLAVGAIVILWLQTSQWYFFDEWAFLIFYGPGPLEPHVGHWSTSPVLLFHALRDVFGLGNYLPFAVPVTLAHLAIAHLIWRIALRAGVQPWIATAGAAVVVFMGSGAENILWAFQVGFLSAFALGLLTFLLATAQEVSRRRFVGMLAASIFALTWSGTAIPLIVATAALLLHRHGWRRAAIYAASTGAVYLAWYVAFAIGNPNNPDTGGVGLGKVFVDIPQFLGVMLLLGWQSVFPVFGIGAAVLIALLVWLIRLRRSRQSLPGLAPALILTGTAALFALVTAYSRAEWSIGAGRSSRYIYVLVVLLLPLCCVALTRLARGRRRWIAGIAALLVGLAGYQAGLLIDAAREQSQTEQRSQRLISAALALYEAEPGAVELTAQPDAEWAPDLALVSAVRLHERGLLPVGEFTASDLEEARAAVGTSGGD